MTILTRFTSAAALVSVTLALAACGGGSGGVSSSSPSATSTKSTYVSTATVGELLDYTIDTSKLTYSYTITNSNFNLDGQTGTGQLVDNHDGTYSPKGIPGATVFPAQNGMLVGTIKLNINGSDQDVPLIGFKNRITSMSALQGTYDYVKRVCDQPAGSCSTDYGTFQISSGGTWTNCPESDLGTISCPRPQTSGTLNALPGGEWQILNQISTKLGIGIAFTAPNGQKVWIIDFENPVANGGAGVGILAGSTESFLTSVDTKGTWLFGGITDSAQYAGTLTVSGTSFTSAGTVLKGSGVSVNGSATFNENHPWNGLIQTSTGTVALLAGTGMYAAVNSTINSFEIGLRQ